ncbi:glycan biosynthesis hexose transferase WsfD [Clostridium sp. 'White wine YQ']|uniref:glycan biosynthesis hexose transferase WsfD n=1 Tax=Clostridium sp. 'White wine YQ' TaxID=3027474 RepID=UPI002366A724|nr:hypothetical protein [Clostridium sp. 'White wine YQ']MDD7794830.1 hypothetical protein [Clostridium sp. 'White wine YQ']
MKLKVNITKLLLMTFIVLAFGIIAFVLFKYPEAGVADQGDFDRVMSVSGLQLPSKDFMDPNFERFYKYPVTDYKIAPFTIPRILITFTSTSMSYLISIISFICKAFGSDIFKTQYLAIAYGIIYTLSIYLIIRYLNIKNKLTLFLLAALSLFVLFDGNYLVWFNSLYGEPMMITTFTLYIASWIYYIYHRYVLKSEKNIFSTIILIFIASFLFLGSKMQVIAALPVILVMLIKLLYENKNLLRPFKKVICFLLLCILIIYPVQIQLKHKEMSKDTQYNSVFYGILKDSENPRQDLINLGLNPDMASEAGKHSYLITSAYTKYIPHTLITEEDFYNKISSGKLIRFYITHPLRLVKGMEYTANNAFSTGTKLGKYSKSYSSTPINSFNRFTLWSFLRNNMLPKNLVFISLIYIFAIISSLFIYIKRKHLEDLKHKIQLFWSILFIGILQFPMPFIGNGQADTTKQLFLFNFTFDIVLIVMITYISHFIFNNKKVYKNRSSS